MNAPPRHRLESALRDAGLDDVQVRRDGNRYLVGFEADDIQGVIAAGVVRHNIVQGTLSEFARTWAEAAGFLEPTPSIWDRISDEMDRVLGFPST